MDGTGGVGMEEDAQQFHLARDKSPEEEMEEGRGECKASGGSSSASEAGIRGRRGGGSSGGVDRGAATGAAGEAERARPRICVNSESEIRWHVRLELALLKRYWPWVAAAVGVEYVHLIAHNLVYYLEGIYYPQGPPPPLEDLGLMLLADRVPERYEWVVGAATCALVGMVLVLALARLTLKNVPWGGPQLEVVEGHGGRARSTVVAAPVAVVLKRACQALALGISLRSITFLVTMMPNPADYCHGDQWNPPRTVAAIFSRWAVEGSCGDLLFSGHTTHGMILTLVIARYAPGLRVVKAVAIGAMLLLALALLAFRSHYTSDVIVAVYVSLMVWRLMPAEPARVDGDALRIGEHGAGARRQTGVDGLAAALPVQAQLPPSEKGGQDAGLLMEEGRGDGDGHSSRSEEA